MGRTKERAWRNSDGDAYKRNKIQKTTTQAAISKGSPRPLKTKSPFVSDDAEKRYNKFTSNQKLFMERGFTWSESSAHEFPDTVTQAIRFHKWENFCQHPSSACIAVVQEFYANYDATRPDSVHVRGKLVDVTASSINSLFELTEHQGTLFELSSKLSPPTMSDILEKLTKPGTVYTRESDETITFPRNSLKAGLNVWFNFVRHNLLPSADDTIVEKDRAILLYCITVGKPINVGKVIAEQIQLLDNDGDEELLDLKQEQQLGQASPIKASSPGIVCVHGYLVKESNVPILEAIFKNYGDIAAESVYTIASVRSSFLEGICEVVRLVQTNGVIEKVEEVERYVSQAEQAKIDVSWLRAYLEAMQKTKETMEESSLLAEMKRNTILVKRAAQTDERQRCAELMAAQERFVEADRCVRVLHFVEKYLGDNLVKLKLRKKDFVVTQPII